MTTPDDKTTEMAIREATIELADPIRTVRLQRRLDAPPYRVYRAWSAPEALSEWFPESVEGSLAEDTRSTLVFKDRRVWWDVISAEPNSALPVPLAVAG